MSFPLQDFDAHPLYVMTTRALSGPVLGSGQNGGVVSALDPDLELLDRVGAGDPAAIRALTARKLPRVLSLATRMLGEVSEAQDVAQDAMFRAWRQAASWRPGVARFDTWLHRVTVNLCYDRLRKRRDVIMDHPPEQIDDGPAPDRGLIAQDVGRRVAAAMAALPDRQREAVTLCHYQDLTNIEAAQAMGLSVDALESLLARGRRALRSALQDMIAP